jgi:hypothetical protein
VTGIEPNVEPVDLSDTAPEVVAAVSAIAAGRGLQWPEQHAPDRTADQLREQIAARFDEPTLQVQDGKQLRGERFQLGGFTGPVVVGEDHNDERDLRFEAMHDVGEAMERAAKLYSDPDIDGRIREMSLQFVEKYFDRHARLMDSVLSSDNAVLSI